MLVSVRGLQGAGTGQDLSPHPRVQGGSLPHPERGRTAGSFPSSSSRVGTCHIPHKRWHFGTVWASLCMAVQLLLAPACVRAGHST